MPLCTHCGHFAVPPRPHSDLKLHPRDRLADVMSEHQPLSRYVDRLSAERESLQAELDLSIVYPVLTVPPDSITSEIFNWCLPSSPHFTQPDPSAPPLVLLAVCRQWRDIALGIPQIWSRVKFRLSRYVTPTRNRNLCVLLKTWLSTRHELETDEASV
ncbi:hypothetical protein C8J57DRAFT_1327353 [Mycena rebaudengoi]|nr:hypothetical protein C8J57DRAFT_1327353 [Mycena rebaudengoi]